MIQFWELYFNILDKILKLASLFQHRVMALGKCFKSPSTKRTFILDGWKSSADLLSLKSNIRWRGVPFEIQPKGAIRGNLREKLSFRLNFKPNSSDHFWNTWKRHIAGWDVLDNHAVNILMSTTSAIFGPLFFSVFYSYFK